VLFGKVFAIYFVQGFCEVKLICEQENVRTMFNSITWGQYFLTVTLLLVCYYVYTGYRYYRWEILGIIGIKKVDDNALGKTTVSDFKNLIVNKNPENYLPKPVIEIDISPLVQSFTDEVNAYLQEAANNKVQKGELLDSFHLIASKYLALKEADCKNELLQFVLFETDKYYPNLLQQKDINQLWN
jgi:hypothetical protein